MTTPFRGAAVVLAYAAEEAARSLRLIGEAK